MKQCSKKRAHLQMSRSKREVLSKMRASLESDARSKMTTVCKTIFLAGKTIFLAGAVVGVWVKYDSAYHIGQARTNH